MKSKAHNVADFVDQKANSLPKPLNMDIEMDLKNSGQLVFKDWSDVEEFIRQLVARGTLAFGPHPELSPEIDQ